MGWRGRRRSSRPVPTQGRRGLLAHESAVGALLADGTWAATRREITDFVIRAAGVTIDDTNQPLHAHEGVAVVLPSGFVIVAGWFSSDTLGPSSATAQPPDAPNDLPKGCWRLKSSSPGVATDTRVTMLSASPSDNPRVLVRGCVQRHAPSISNPRARHTVTADGTPSPRRWRPLVSSTWTSTCARSRTSTGKPQRPRS